FTKIIYNPDRYNPERPFKTWLYSIANNMCKNEYKKQEVRNTVNSEIQNNAMVLSEHTGGGVEIDNEAFGIMLRKHVDELDEHHKTTFILRFYQELPIKEIGKIMQCSEGTVKSRLFYTLKKLAVKMKAYRLHYTT
ncbi:MAG: RNA polymerase sigma factor, partial [Bacteroidales bacterium]|nr:RNA polymerase sigma factor [Bacteroidales bacterium]